MFKNETVTRFKGKIKIKDSMVKQTNDPYHFKIWIQPHVMLQHQNIIFI